MGKERPKAKGCRENEGRKKESLHDAFLFASFFPCLYTTASDFSTRPKTSEAGTLIASFYKPDNPILFRIIGPLAYRLGIFFKSSSTIRSAVTFSASA